ncbi:MAG: hypothetical protein M3471_00880, partial [Actinomycetota bacterium]|nr:hypothetical protein [Actinomycetota bacterium]
MGFLKRLLGGGDDDMTITDGVDGTATVVSIGRPHSHAVRYLLPVRLSVQAPGMAPFLHETSALIHRDRFPEPGVLVPVTVDRTDPRRVKIHWDRLPTIAE